MGNIRTFIAAGVWFQPRHQNRDRLFEDLMHSLQSFHVCYCQRMLKKGVSLQQDSTPKRNHLKDHLHILFESQQSSGKFVERVEPYT